MSWNLSVCSFVKVSDIVDNNFLIQAVQSPWVQSCEMLFVGSISIVSSNNGSLSGWPFIRNNTCESSVKFVAASYDLFQSDFNSTVTIPLGANETSYLNTLYENYNGSFAFDQPCPVCNASFTVGNFLSICYGNCSANQLPYIFDSSFETYTQQQCIAPPVMSFSYVTPTSTPTLLPIANEAILIIPNIIINFFALFVLIRRLVL